MDATESSVRARLFTEAQATDIRSMAVSNPSAKMYGEVTYRGVNIGMGFKTVREYVAMMNTKAAIADTITVGELNRCHNRMVFMSALMRTTTKLSSPFFVPLTQRKEIRKVAHIIGPKTNAVYVADDGTVLTATPTVFEVTDELIESIIDEFITGVITLIRRERVQLDLSHNIKFGMVSPNMSEKQFLSRLKESMSTCYAPDCFNHGTKTCSVCFGAKYCSTDCQKKHWKLRHKDMCKPKNADSVRILDLSTQIVSEF